MACLLGQPNISTINGLRDIDILELLFYSGLRVSELVGMDKDHINLKRRELTVKGKVQKDRPPEVPPRTRLMLIVDTAGSPWWRCRKGTIGRRNRKSLTKVIPRLYGISGEWPI